MPFTVEDLLEGRPEPVTALANENVQDAIKRMVEHSFSQLPVVDHDGKPVGMLTSDSILRALNHFGAKPDALRIHDAMVQIEDKQKFRADEDLFILLDDLRDTYAVVIVDRDGKLIGVVTTYDTTEYFRRRAEDMMLVREIEKLIKDYILEAFKGSDGKPDEAALEAAIEQIMPSNQGLRGPFGKALSCYLQKHTNGKPSINQQWLNDAFTQHLYEKQKTKPFDDLHFNEYIDLLLHADRWPRYSQAFHVDKPLIRKLLEAVRRTRNDLAHLREDITPQQRDELQFCTKWLARYETSIQEAFGTHQAAVATQPTDPIIPSVIVEDPGSPELHVSPPEDAVGPRDSRYAPLALFLQQQPLERKQLVLNFQEIETIIDDTLPESAERRQFWANDSIDHVQSRQWLEAGWRVATINMTERRITFARIEGRQRAYIDFFSGLIADLRKHPEFPLQHSALSPSGWHWHSLARVPLHDPFVGTLGVSFTIGRRARVELYIDNGEAEWNKRMFDALHERKAIIEAHIEQQLEWERLDTKRASRIAVYRTGSINSSTNKLVELRAWAVDIALRLQPVLESHVSAIVDALDAAPQTSEKASA